ncbi:MAG: DUF1501 domain-containing protein [Bacteroidota bacterium]
MKRRDFLQTSAATSLPLLLNGMGISVLPKSAMFGAVNGDSDRVLVLIQLNGGNDGLSSIIPLDQYSQLASARTNILIPENTVLNLTPETGMHPSMEGLKSLYDDAKLSIIQSVGYPNQNRSHFRSSDIWHTGSAADEFLTTGWLGRYFESKYPNYPTDYPNEDCPDPFAITIGSLISETCQGTTGNYSLAINDAEALGELSEPEPGEIPLDTCYGFELNYVRQSIAQTNAYSSTILNAANSATNLATYPETELAQSLKVVAQLISGGLQTRVYVVSLGGFDTHADQTVEGAPTTGIHATLLQTLSDAIAAFQQDLQLLNLEERVVGMTFSEFGRQIKSNDSFGTDHGNAAPLLVFGTCVNPAIIGDNPEIPEVVNNQDGVPLQFDFRSVYGSILMDWFEVSETEVKTLLYAEFQYIPLLQPCTITSTNDPDRFKESIETYHYPNPFQDWVHIVFTSKAEWAKVSIYNSLGQEIRVLADRQFLAGEHTLSFEARGLPAGNYHYRIITRDRQKTKVMIKA